MSLFVTFGSIIAEAFGVLDPIKSALSEILELFKRIFNLTAEARQASAAGGSLVESLVPEDLLLEPIRSRRDQERTGEDIRGAIKEAIIEGATGSREEFVDSLAGDLMTFLQR